MRLISSIFVYAVTIGASLISAIPHACQSPDSSLAQLQKAQPLRGLPANGNASLAYVALGVGVQNYTCSSRSAAPQSVGAIASLFNITSLAQRCGVAAATKIGTTYLKQYEAESCQASQDLHDNICQSKINRQGFEVIGHHWFGNIGGSSVPFFSIPGHGFLSATKSGDVSAPAGAYGGSNGAGAVDWLFLPSDGSQRSIALFEVYRIETAGGEPDGAGCSSGAKELSVKYTAQYWFFTKA